MRHHKSGAPGRIRTFSLCDLSAAPLPIGLPEHVVWRAGLEPAKTGISGRHVYPLHHLHRTGRRWRNCPSRRLLPLFTAAVLRTAGKVSAQMSCRVARRRGRATPQGRSPVCESICRLKGSCCFYLRYRFRPTAYARRAAALTRSTGAVGGRQALICAEAFHARGYLTLRSRAQSEILCGAGETIQDCYGASARGAAGLVAR